MTTTVDVAAPTPTAPIPPPRAGLLGALRLRVFGLDDSKVAFETLGFTALDDAAREQLEAVGIWFARGFRAAMAETDSDKLGPYLRNVDREFRGFAFEGAAVALTVLDSLVPTAGRLRNLVQGPGVPHAWLLPVGYGWAKTELRRMPKRPPTLFDPLSGWLAIDGAGFHNGFNHPERYLEEARPKHGLSEAAGHVYDQGLGRALWFYRGGDPDRIAPTIAGFPHSRRADVWAGLATAATYAGGVGEDVLVALRERAGDFEPEVGVGAVLAAKTRLLGGDVVPHTEVACSALWGGSVTEAGRLADSAQEGLDLAGHASAYDALRARLRQLVAEG